MIQFKLQLAVDRNQTLNTPGRWLQFRNSGLLNRFFDFDFRHGGHLQFHLQGLHHCCTKSINYDAIEYYIITSAANTYAGWMLRIVWPVRWGKTKRGITASVQESSPAPRHDCGRIRNRNEHCSGTLLHRTAFFLCVCLCVFIFHRLKTQREREMIALARNYWLGLWRLQLKINIDGSDAQMQFREVN